MKLSTGEYLSFITLIIAFVVLVNTDSGIDSMSGATAKAKSDLVLPKENPDYTVYVSEGLENFSVEYDARFHRGGEIESVEGAEVLKKYNIDTIISITPNDRERNLLKQYKLNLVELEFGFETIPHETLAKFVDSVNNAKGSVYAHCHSGSHRAGVLGMVYRVVKNGWSVERAEKEFIALGGYPVKDKKILDAAKEFLKGL